VANALRDRRDGYVVVEASAPLKVAEGIRTRLARKPVRGGTAVLGRARGMVLHADDEEQ